MVVRCWVSAFSEAPGDLEGRARGGRSSIAGKNAHFLTKEISILGKGRLTPTEADEAVRSEE